MASDNANYKVNDQVAISIYFATASSDRSTATFYELPLQFGNSLNSMHMSAGATIKLPVMELQVTDVLRFFDAFAESTTADVESGLTDGSLVKLVIASAYDSSATTTKRIRYFRVYNWERSTVASGYSYVISCYWDSPEYWAKVAGTEIEDGGDTSTDGGQLPIVGTSSAALKKIATACAIDVDVANDRYGTPNFQLDTNDSMMWVPHNRTYGSWAKDIANYGFKSDGPTASHMVMGITSLGKLRYKDINPTPTNLVTVSLQRTAADVNAQNSDPTKQTHLCQDFSPKSKAGINNILGGYGIISHIPTVAVSGALAPDTYQDPPFKSQTLYGDMGTLFDAKDPLISTTIQAKVADCVVKTYAPIDFGNAHANYQTAKYQNLSCSLWNGLLADVLFTYITDWEVCDQFNLRAPYETSRLADPSLDPYSGLYTVVTKTILIAGSNYYEKVVVARNGLYPKT